MNLSCDILLVTATSSEFGAFKVAARALGLDWTKRQGMATEYRHLGELQGSRVAVFQLKRMGSMSSRGSAFTCYRALQETHASSILGVGTAFGVNERAQKIGDLVVSDSVHLYDEGTVVDDARSGYRYVYDAASKVSATERWVDRFRNADPARMPWPSGRAAPALNVGPLLSGGARIESGAFRDHLIGRVAAYGMPVVGGEMEAVGIAAACAAVSSQAWVIVKAISDFATAASRAQIERTRGPAAENAAWFTLQALMQP